MRRKAPLVLAIFDGWGISENTEANAIALARTPTYDRLVAHYPNTTLEASGEAVGLPAGQMGNSEVGHMNMGAGRVVYQDLTRIDSFIDDGRFFENEVLRRLMERCTAGGHALHLFGLVSDGGVHSHVRHQNALITMASSLGVKRLFVHAITDGRDTSPTSGVRHIAHLEGTLAARSVGRIASVTGRYYAMDRDHRWERTRRAFDAISRGVGLSIESPVRFVEDSYRQGVTDEFLEPAVVVADGHPVGPLRDGDSVLCFNFRADRVRQLTRALTVTGFDAFERASAPKVTFACLTEYDATLGLPVAFPPQSFSGSLAEVLCQHAFSNLRLAETEKYAHVTYFFNCGVERPYPGEDRVLIPSPHVATYDLQPEMSARQIADYLVQDIRTGEHAVIICNFANADMVGHTGNLTATIRAVETLDDCLAKIATTVEQIGGQLILTADHGNCEQMWDAKLNEPHTAHTSNPVPLLIMDSGPRASLRAGGSLRDVAPTILGLLELPLSPEMTGVDLRRL